MALTAELQRLHDSLSCCTSNGAQHTHVLIKETDSLAKLKSVTLSTPAGDWFSFDPDKGRGKPQQMSPLLATGAAHNHHRACDCVVLINRDGQLTALYVDLKSGNPVGYSGQFKSTRQFVRYALGLLKEFHGSKLTLAEERFVVLYGGKPALLNKTTTVPKLEKLGKTQPDKPHKREVPQPAMLYLKELLT
ncbi:MAG TPA: hypothetical protein PLD03_10090 [Thiomonas arsenitoxydans]|nr:hypothetical protein [Thiomonas arsenitoxydans]